MTAPALTVYATGGASVTGDNLNTMAQTANTMADLRAFIGIAGVQVFVRGTAAPNDGGSGNFYWNSGGTGPDDNGVTTVVPYGANNGVWTRIVPQVGFRSNNTALGPFSTTSATFVMVGLGIAVTPRLTGAFLVLICGEAQNLTPSNAALFNLAVGAGQTPPGTGAPATGTVLTANVEVLLPGGGIVPFSMNEYISGLTVGAPYWVDMQFAQSLGGTAQIANLTVTVIEL